MIKDRAIERARVILHDSSYKLKDYEVKDEQQYGKDVFYQFVRNIRKQGIIITGVTWKKLGDDSRITYLADIPTNMSKDKFMNLIYECSPENVDVNIEYIQEKESSFDYNLAPMSKKHLYELSDELLGKFGDIFDIEYDENTNQIKVIVLEDSVEDVQKTRKSIMGFLDRMSFRNLNFEDKTTNEIIFGLPDMSTATKETKFDIIYYGISQFSEGNNARVVDLLTMYVKDSKEIKKLINEEEDAVESYEEAIENEQSNHKKKVFKHILSEEEEHIDELNAINDSEENHEFRLSKKKNEYDEYVVKEYVNRKFREDGSYYTDDWDDAIATIKDIAKRLNMTVSQKGDGYIARKETTKDNYLGVLPKEKRYKYKGYVIIDAGYSSAPYSIEGYVEEFKTLDEAKKFIRTNLTDAVKQYIYQFFPMADEDVKELDNYNLNLLGVIGEDGFQPGDYAVKGSLEDLEKYCDEYLGYTMHPDYLYEEDDFDTEVLVDR